MSEVLAVRGSDQVMRELAQTKASVIEAKRVLIVGAGALPKLLGELNDSLAELGYVCVPLEPAQGLYKTFADLLACPVLSALHDVEPEPMKPLRESYSGHSEAIPFGAYLPCDDGQDDLPPPPPENPPAPAVAVVAEPIPEPEPMSVQPVAVKLDMSKPINWKLGDVFISNPRITLPHKSRKWILDSLDISDLENLSGIDVQIRSPNTTTTELLTLKQFMAQYVFHKRPVAEQSAAE